MLIGYAEIDINSNLILFSLSLSILLIINYLEYTLIVLEED